MQVAQVALSVMAAVFFLAVARVEKDVTVRMHDRRADSGIVVPLPAGLIGLLEQLNISQIVLASTFDAVRSFREFYLMCQIDLSRIDRFNADGDRDPYF